MGNAVRSLKSLLGAAGLAVASLMATTPVAVAQEPIPIDYFAVRAQMQSPVLSPDGKHIAYLLTQGKEGLPVLEIRKTDDLGNVYRRLGGGRMELLGVSWLDEETLIVNTWAKVRRRIEGFNQGVYEQLAQSYNIESEEFSEFSPGTGVVNLLPGDPDHVIVRVPRVNAPALGEEDRFAAFRPANFYKTNLRTGRQELLYKGNFRQASAVFDQDGNPRFSSGYDAATKDFVYYGRKPGESSWREIYRLDSFSNEDFNLVHLPEDDPSKIWVSAQNGENFRSVWEFDIDSGEFTRKLFSRPDVDVIGVRFNSADWTEEANDPAGFTYFGHRVQVEWTDPSEQALDEQLRQVIPNAWNLGIQRSRDDRVMLVTNSGPRDPGSYYLFIDGQPQYLGGSAPQLTPEMLHDVEYIKYPARDGKIIPAYVTVPKGEGPFPLVVVPHGGPFVSEVVGWDEWGQFLASRGYMVLQPQYRGSLGYGMDHFLSALSQSGLAMQDDKDDGVKYLIEQGRVDPDRVAMFGWSYGGYAALVAAVRTTEQLYQCAIAGAPVSDPNMQLNYYRDSLIPATEEFELQRRTGVSPYDIASDINIPLLMIHGDLDQRVPVEHAEKMARALDRAGKSDMYEYVELTGADHFFVTLYYRHFKELYDSLEEYLANDCGPGGL